jgi:tRNA modification GTPase
MKDDSTICAIASPPGQGAISIVRLSGSKAFVIAGSIFSFHDQSGRKNLENQAPNTLHYGKIINKNKEIDDVIIGLFKEPNSYTGEDTIEISCHGSVYIQQKILELLINKGARLAKPGEFTLRAFLNGKLDLSQAEGVADMIASSSEATHRLALNQMRGGFSKEIKNLRQELLNFISLIELELDFSEEDVEFADRKQLMALAVKMDDILTSLITTFEYGNAIKNGIPVAIIGPANSGKSTLLNRLLHEDRAIVSEIAGTTRDFIEDIIVLQGIRFRFIDTAGLRHSVDQIEKQGIQRTHQKYQQADIVIVMVDMADDPALINKQFQFIRKEENKHKHLIFAINKADKYSADLINERTIQYKELWSDVAHILDISAKKNIGIDALENLLISTVLKNSPGENDIVVTNVRHFEALKRSSEALVRVKEGLQSGISGDLLAMDIREVLHYLGEITGEITTDEILGNIFKNFCIGK